MKTETTQLWSIYVGAWQTYHTIRAATHKLPNLTDLATPSYYVDEQLPKDAGPGRRLLWGTVMNKDGTYGDDKLYRLTKRGLVFVRTVPREQ